MGKVPRSLRDPPSIGQLHGLFETAMAMELVVGPHADSLETCGNSNAREASLEGLFVDMGMMQDSRGQDLVSAGFHDVPAIGVVIPALVVVRDGDPEEADTLPGVRRRRDQRVIGLRLRSRFALERDRHDVGFTCAGCCRSEDQDEDEA